MEVPLFSEPLSLHLNAIAQKKYESLEFKLIMLKSPQRRIKDMI